MTPAVITQCVKESWAPAEIFERGGGSKPKKAPHKVKKTPHKEKKTHHTEKGLLLFPKGRAPEGGSILLSPCGCYCPSTQCVVINYNKQASLTL